MGETGSVALLRPIFVVTHYRAGNLRTENLRNLYGVEGGTLTKVVASDKQSEPMLDRWISTHAAHEHWITTGRHQFGTSATTTPAAPRKSSSATSTGMSRLNWALIESECPAYTGTRTQVPDTSSSGISRILRLSSRSLTSSSV